MSCKRTHSEATSSEGAEDYNSDGGMSSKYFKPQVTLTADFFNRPCLDLARDLLGKVVCRRLDSGELLKGKIVETESYLGMEDVASHSFNGKRTPRNVAMFMTPGTAYVYVIYGMYNCFNISSQEEGSAVLLRAVEPLTGLQTMSGLRSVRRKEGGQKLKLTDLCSGPSKLCQAFSIDKQMDQVDVCSSRDIWLEEGEDLVDAVIVTSCRVGIDSCGPEWAAKPFRFYILGNKHVSARDRRAETQIISAV